MYLFPSQGFRAALSCAAVVSLSAAATAGETWTYNTFQVSDLTTDSGQADFGAEVFFNSNVHLSDTLEIDRQAFVQMEDTCSIGSTVMVRDLQSTFQMNGGSINYLLVQESGSAMIHGGTVNGYVELTTGSLVVSGGTFVDPIMIAGTGSTIDLQGSDFSYTNNGNTTVVDNGTTVTLGGYGTFDISGRLLDGSLINIEIQVSNASITIESTAIPGPIGSVLALSTLFVARRRRNA